MAAATPLVEAESIGVGMHLADAACFGGAAVTSDRAWEPLLHMPAPPTDFDPVSLWVRHRHGPLQPKAVRGDQQVDLAWHWPSPTEWTWSRLGTWPRADVAEGVVVIRGNVNAAAESAIDAAQWTDAQAAAPEDPAAIPRVTISVAWRETIGTAGAPTGHWMHGIRSWTPACSNRRRRCRR